MKTEEFVVQVDYTNKSQCFTFLSLKSTHKITEFTRKEVYPYTVYTKIL